MQSKPATKLQELFAPYWTSEPGWVTELQLRNNLPSHALSVTPVLMLASGREIPLGPVTIAADDSVSVYVNEGLLEHAPSLLSQPGSYGPVLFRFVSANAQNLHATVILSIHGEPIAFPIPARPTARTGSAASRATSLEGIWWQPRNGLKDILLFGNSSDKKVNGTLSLFDAGGIQWSEALTLDPRQTVRIATADLLLQAKLGGAYGGISFAVPSAVTAVDAVHLIYDEQSQFSTKLDFFTRDPSATVRERAGKDAAQWTLRAPMLALANPDPGLGFSPKTLLQPTIFLRNTTAKTISASVALNWRGETNKGQAKLPALQLAPFATQQLQISAMQKLLQIADDAHWALVSVTTTAQPDDLIALASAVTRPGAMARTRNSSADAAGALPAASGESMPITTRLVPSPMSAANPPTPC